MKHFYKKFYFLSPAIIKQVLFNIVLVDIKPYRFFLLLFSAILFAGNTSAVTYRYPLAVTAFTGGMNYCDNRAAQPLSLTFSTTTCGAGGNTNVTITVTWYSNTVNSTVGGTPVQTVNSTAATTNFIYVPLTTPVGTLYYYATVSWAAIGCVTAGSITTASTQPVTINSCPQSADMPDPPSNLKTVPAGSYVIPMDNSHQNLWLTYPFNIKAYGLVDSLLLNDIPVYWVIKSGKLKDSSDFSAVVSRVYPTVTGAALQYFKASEFIIDTAWLNKSYYSGGKTALQIITPFATRWKVAVYKLSANTTVDIRYTLHQRPKIACFNNGTYQQVATKLLDSAKMGNFVAISAGVFTGLADCYTFCTEMHWSTATLADSSTMAPVWQFIQEGGNFLGQCAGENTYENLMQVPRHFHTTKGTTQHNPGALPPNYYENADMAFAQFQGTVVPRSGTTADWNLVPGSSFDTETYNCMTSVSRDTIVASSRHYGSPDSVGGNVFYIGGHDYMTNTATSSDADSVGAIRYINGTRMFLNACLIPAHRPTAFALDPGLNTTICSGDSTKLGGSPTGPAGSTYSWAPTTGLSNPTAANPMASPAVTTTYTVIAFDGSCEGGPSTVTVFVNPTPATPTAGSNSPICAGSTLNLTTPTVAGATYSWTGPNSFTSTAQNPSIVGATVAASGTYSVTVTVGGCTSLPGTVSVIVNPSPAAPTAGSNSPMCAGSTLNLTTPTVGGATYSWTGPNSFSSTSQNPSITNATVAASGTYSVTITVGGCTSPAGTVNVTVNPIPATPTAGSNSPICAGSTLNLTTPTVVGATYSWTGPNSFSSTLQNPSITNATVAASGTYSVTVTVGGCTSAAGTVVVTVSPIPATPTPSSNSPICAGLTLNLTTPTVVGATYSWTGPNSFSSALQNPSITNATVAASGTYSVTVTVGGCTSAPGTVVVTVNPTPATPTPSSNSPICAGSTLNLTTPTVVGATYSWTGPNSFSSSSQNPSITNATVAASGTYSVTVTVAGCTSAAGTVAVTVNPTPATPTAGSNSPICAGSTLNLTTPTVVGATYNWTGPNSFSSTLQNPSITNATVAASGTYSVTVTVGGCTSLPGTVTVTVNPIPATPTPGSNSPLCSGSTLNLTTPTVVGATYSWTGPNSFSSSLQNPSITNVTLAAAGTYSVTVTVAGCTSPVGTVTVVVNPTPATPTAGSNSPICAGSTLNLTTPTVVGATYSWTGPNGFSSSSQNPFITNATVAASGTYSVTVTVGGCTSAAGTVAVTVNPIPATPTASSNSPLCAGSTLNLTTPTVVGATYSWTGPNGFSSSSQNPSITNATVAASGTYSVTVTIGGCTSAIGTVAVTVSPIPATPTASSNSPICAGSTLNLTTPTVVGATYSWTGPNSFSSSSQNPSIVGATVAASGTYSVTVTVGGCTSAAGTVAVTVNPSPATPTPGSNSPICAGSTLNLTTPTVVGATYSWTGPNSFSSSSQNPSIVGATVADAGTYSVTVTVAGCTSPAGTVNVIIDTPAVVNAGTNQTVCANNDSIHLSGTSSTGTGKWTTSGTGTFSPNATTLNAIYVPSNADTTAGSVTLTLTSTNNGACSAVTSKITITFTHAPTDEAGANQTVCANNGNVTLGGSFTIATGGIWSTSGSGIFSPSNTNMGATYTPSNADTTAGSVLIILTTTGNGKCKAVTDSMKITFTHAPNVYAGINDTVCSNNPDVSLNGKSSTGSGQWTTSGTGTFTPNNTTLNATYVPSAADITAGTITLTLTSTSNGNCLAVSSSIVIIITPPPTVVAGPNVTVCANNDSIKLSGTSSTGSGHWTTSGTGTFSPNSNLLNATYVPSNADTAAGSVTLTLASTNNGGCLAVTDKLTVTFTHAPTAEAGVNASVCSNNGNVILNGSFTIAGGGIWSTTGSGTFSPSNTNMSATYTPSNADTAAGTVFIILTTTGNGKCKAVTDTMQITYTNAPHVEAGNDTTVCLSSPDFKLNGYSSTGSGSWTTLGSGTFSPNNTTLNATYNPSTADTTAKKVTLILTSTANGGCNPVTDTIILTYSTVPTANAGTNQTVCANNANVSLNATSSTGTGKWTTSGSGTFSPNNTTLNATYIPSPADTTAGTVTLTFTATGGCIPVSQSIVITITHAPDVNAGPDQFICKNNSLNATLNGSIGGGSSTGKWTTLGSGTFSPNDSALNATYIPSTADTAAGSVTLVLTSTNNGTCFPVTDTVIIHYTIPPVSEAGTNLSGCANNSIPLNGTISGGSGTGVWTTPNGTGTFSPNNTTLNGSYTPSNGDTAVGTVILILTSTNNGGCLAASDTITITVTPGPIVNAGPNQTVCKNNDNVNLSGNILHASGGKWSTTGSGTFTPNDSALSVTYIPSSADTSAGSVKIILTSTGNGICQSTTDTMVITFSPAPKVEAGATIFVCTGTMTASLNGSVSGGSSTGKWTTSGSGTFSPNDSALNATYNLSSADTTAKTVTLVLTSTHNGTCLAATDTVVIKITPVPSVEAGKDTSVCANNPNINLGGIVVGGSGTGVWTTSGSGTFSPGDSVLNATYSPSTADTAGKKVTLILTATNSCLPVSDSITLTFTPAPTINPGTNQTICAGDIVNLNGSVTIASGGVWTTSGNGTFTPNASTLNATYTPGSADTAAGTVVLVLTSSGNGNCIAVKDSITVTIQSKPKANFKSTPACLNSSINFTDLSTVSKGSINAWWWNFGNGVSTTQNPTNTYSGTGTQTVTLAVSTSAGCTDTTTRNIYVNPLPTASYIESSFCPDSAQFTDKSAVAPGSIKSWAWTFGDSASSNLQDPGHTYSTPGTYSVTLTVTSDSGCKASYVDTISVNICPDNSVSNPAVPSAFTPNGDGNNDVLYVKGGPFSQLDFRVFDEWGNQLFKATSQSQGWDGKYGGKPQPGGTYTWTLTGTTVNGKSYKMTGDVTILR